MKVVLDLDETLVCAYESCSLAPAVRSQAIEGGLNWFEMECVTVDQVCLHRSSVQLVIFYC